MIIRVRTRSLLGGVQRVLLERSSNNGGFSKLEGLSILRFTKSYQTNQHGFRGPKVEDDRQKLVQRKKDCRTLNLPEDCTDAGLVRDAYIKLAKKYHPDGGNKDASAEKFQLVDSAYKNLLKDFADFRHNRHRVEGEYGLYYQEEEEESTDIKHTAPQHRQYLSNDGVGSGTPFQREKQYNKYRWAKAAENIMEYRIQKVAQSSGEEVWALAKDARASKKTKTGIGVDRLVEDLIQESMAKGEFDNLSGKGKPLKHDSTYNPYIDFTTHKLNQVLIENGFAPEWIMLEKDIRQEIRKLRKDLAYLRHKYGPVLSTQEEIELNSIALKAMKTDCDSLNRMILKFNLTVPSLHKQLVLFQLEKEAKKAGSTFSLEIHKLYAENAERRRQFVESNAKQSTSNESLFGMFLAIFKG